MKFPSIFISFYSSTVTLWWIYGLVAGRMKWKKLLRKDIKLFYLPVGILTTLIMEWTGQRLVIISTVSILHSAVSVGIILSPGTVPSPGKTFKHFCLSFEICMLSKTLLPFCFITKRCSSNILFLREAKNDLNFFSSICACEAGLWRSWTVTNIFDRLVRPKFTADTCREFYTLGLSSKENKKLDYKQSQKLFNTVKHKNHHSGRQFEILLMGPRSDDISTFTAFNMTFCCVDNNSTFR